MRSSLPPTPPCSSVENPRSAARPRQAGASERGSKRGRARPRNLAAELGSGAQGLAAGEAARRLKQEDARAGSLGGARAIAALIWRQLGSPLVLILVFAAALSLALRQWGDAVLVLAIVGCSAALGFAQEYRASRAIERLRARLAPVATVRRAGKEVQRPVRELVAGDIVLLAPGKPIPADGVVLASAGLSVDESSLTGEAFPVEKRCGVLPADTPLAARSNCVHAGTSVRGGSAEMLVLATGGDTEFGAIAARGPAAGLERPSRAACAISATRCCTSWCCWCCWR